MSKLRAHSKLPRLLGLLCVTALAVPPACSGPKDSANPSEATRDLAEGKAPVEVELYRVEYRFESDGTYTRSLEHRYTILDQRGIDGWGQSQAHWSPWYMDRPTISATVTSPSGKVTTLDPATISEAPAYPNAPDIYSDAKVLRVPLPALEVGATVEEVIEYSTHRPFIAKGSSHTIVLQAGTPRDRVEVIVDVPEQMAFDHELRGIEAEINETREAGRRRFQVSATELAALDLPESNLPYDRPTWPQLVFSTGSSWKEYAQTYAEIVEQRLADVDLSDIAKKVVHRRDDDRTKADKLLAWLRSKVRYTGIEFGESAVVPYAPAEVLERGYGDCKDQAILLVALLDAVGVEARVALLRAGQGDDVRPELPALNVFNHAIVVLPGRDPLWIDPTTPYARVGELPIVDRGRWALIADNGTDELLRTPLANAQVDSYREVRDIHLAAIGHGKVIEHTTATGVLEQVLRRQLSSPPEQLRKGLESYVNESYESETLADYKVSDHLDLTRKFEVELEVEDAGNVYTEYDSASTDIGYGPLFNWIPNALFSEEERRDALLLPSPYRAELVHRVHPPSGFVLDTLPEFSEIDLGAVQLTRTARKAERGAVEVEFALEFTVDTLSTEQIETFRAGAERLNSERLPALRFVHAGARAIEKGELKQGIALYRKAMKANPKSGMERMRYGAALHDLGFGDEAKRIARKAAEMAADDVVVQRLLSFVLASDGLGRRFARGWDRDGAIAAYRRALELEADEAGKAWTTTQLAVLLEHDADGNRYEDPKALAEAIKLYDSIDKQTLAAVENGKYRHNVLFALIWADRWSEVKSRLDDLPANETPHTIAISTAAMQDGPTGGLRALDKSKLTGERKDEAINAVAEILIAKRAYPAALALLEAHDAGSQRAEAFQTQARLLRRVRKVDAAKVRANNPANLLRKFLIDMTTRYGEGMAAFEGYFSQRILAGSDRQKGNELLEMGALAQVPPSRRALIGDLFAGNFKAEIEGNATTGWRVRGHAPELNGVKITFYVVRERGKLKFRAAENQSQELAREALYWYGKRKPNIAGQWLRWAVDELGFKRTDDTLDSHPFNRIWAEGRGDGRLAAQTIIATQTADKDAVEALQAAFRSADDEVERARIQHALVLAHDQLGQGKEMLEHARDIISQQPEHRTARSLLRSALRLSGRARELEKVVRKYLRDAPVDMGLHFDLLYALENSNRLPAARKHAEKLIADGKNNAALYNWQAWRALFSGKVTDRDLGYALRAVQNRRSANYLHTLASVYLARGKVADARKTWTELIGKRPNAVPHSVDYYILGGIAEALSLTDVARGAYERVDKPSTKETSTTHQLARKRLARLPRKGRS